ncbi:MAG: hypothetical protein H8D23_16610 [Candidatus Brocadiales bacterium]|nr:hypothetical protein [Candidatus Brocadiales bacterium]
MIVLKAKKPKVSGEFPLEVAMRENRIGKFIISSQFIGSSLHSMAIGAVMSRVLITRAENLFHMHGIEYYAYSTLFEPVEEFNSIPEYELTYDENSETLNAKLI